MSLECLIGPESNLLESLEENAHRLRLKHPILSNEELISIKNNKDYGWTTKTIDITYERGSGASGLKKALKRICTESEDAIKQGYSFVLLSDEIYRKVELPKFIACMFFRPSSFS